MLLDPDEQLAPADADLLRITDDPDEACEIVDRYVDGHRAAAAETAPETTAIEPEAVQPPTKPDERES